MKVLLAPEMSASKPYSLKSWIRVWKKETEKKGEKGTEKQGLPPTLKLDVPLMLQSQQIQTI